MISVTGNPSSAYPIAGASSSDMGSVPNRARKSSQPATQPGTDQHNSPSPGMLVSPFCLNTSRLSL